jgi:hypothetical protein
LRASSAIGVSLYLRRSFAAARSACLSLPSWSAARISSHSALASCFRFQKRSASFQSLRRSTCLIVFCSSSSSGVPQPLVPALDLAALHQRDGVGDVLADPGGALLERSLGLLGVDAVLGDLQQVDVGAVRLGPDARALHRAPGPDQLLHVEQLLARDARAALGTRALDGRDDLAQRALVPEALEQLSVRRQDQRVRRLHLALDVELLVHADPTALVVGARGREVDRADLALELLAVDLLVDRLLPVLAVVDRDGDEVLGRLGELLRDVDVAVAVVALLALLHDHDHDQVVALLRLAARGDEVADERLQHRRLGAALLLRAALGLGREAGHEQREQREQRGAPRESESLSGREHAGRGGRGRDPRPGRMEIVSNLVRPRRAG